MATALAAETHETDAAAPASRTRERLDLLCQRGILGVVLLVLVFAPLATGAVRMLDFLVVQGLAVLGLGLWVARMWAQQRFRLFWPPICWAVLAFILYAIVRSQLAEVEYVARLELFKVIVYGAVFFLIVNNLNRRESATVVSVTLIALALGMAIFAVFQFATHYPVIWQFLKPDGYLTRGSGTFINPNHLAGFLEMVLPLALSCALLGRFSPAMKVVLAYSGFMIMAGIGVSLSRGGIIASALILMAFFTVLLLNRDFWLRAILLLVVVVIAVFAVGSRMDAAHQRFATMFASGKLEDQRFRYWDAAVQIYHKDIWWGAGPGHYDVEFRAYRPPDVQNRPTYVHNDYLNTLCDWGIVGLGIIGAAVVLLYAGVARTWSALRKSLKELGPARSNKSAFVLGAALGLLALLLHSVVDYNMHIPANALVAVSLMALLSAQWRFVTERFWVNPGWLGKACLTIGVLVAGGALTMQGFRQGLEAYWLDRADDEETYSDQKFSFLMSAYEAEPKNPETSYALGEFYRLKSWQGDPGYQKLAQEAIKWFEQGMKLNPYDPYSPLRYGMCLDWLGRKGEATRYIERAVKLDPNSSYVAVYQGWHFMELKNYPEAKRCFERSLSLSYNDLAAGYLAAVNERLAQGGNPLKM